MATETHETITAWQYEVFGPVHSPLGAVRRALIEYAELLHAVELRDPVAAVNKAADIVIVLQRYPGVCPNTVKGHHIQYVTQGGLVSKAFSLGRIGFYLAETIENPHESSINRACYYAHQFAKTSGLRLGPFIDAKMATNRTLQFITDGLGFGQSVKRE